MEYNPNSDRSQMPVPPSHYLPFLMGHLDEKVLTRLPTLQQPHPNLGLYFIIIILQLNHQSQYIFSISYFLSSNSSTSDIPEQTSSSYLTTFDHHRRVKLELQDATA